MGVVAVDPPGEEQALNEAILAVATLAGMTLFTWLTLIGMDRFRLERFERYEAGMLAALFLVLSVLALVIQHEH